VRYAHRHGSSYRFVLSNCLLTFLVRGLIVVVMAIAVAQRPVSGQLIVEKLPSCCVSFAIGMTFLFQLHHARVPGHRR